MKGLRHILLLDIRNDLVFSMSRQLTLGSDLQIQNHGRPLLRLPSLDWLLAFLPDCSHGSHLTSSFALSCLIFDHLLWPERARALDENRRWQL